MTKTRKCDKPPQADAPVSLEMWECPTCGAEVHKNPDPAERPPDCPPDCPFCVPFEGPPVPMRLIHQPVKGAGTQ